MPEQCGAAAGEPEYKIPSRAGVLGGEKQVMEIEMQILFLSVEKAPINQE